MIQAMWPHIGGWLLKGQLEVFGGDLRKAMAATTIIAIGIQRQRMQCWAVIDERAKRVVAAGLTQIRLIDGRRVVWVAGLAGEGITRWARALSDRIATFAKDAEAEGFQFVGRKAALRLYPGVRIIGEDGSGLHVFERAAA
jgi:hypothetical protein